MQGRRKSKKRKTGKSMQHQTSTVTSNDNEDDDDDDEEVGDIRTNSNGEKKKSQTVWKSPEMSHLNFSILAFSTNFCPMKTDLTRQNGPFLAFLLNFWPLYI